MHFECHMRAPRSKKRRASELFVAAALVLLLASGCAKKKTVPAAPVFRIGMTEEGVASWYGHPYHGRASSSGEIYDMEKLTAAHRTLPFGTLVRVRNLSNDRTVDVRINDRGPFVGDRIIDLSRAAAREIRMIGPGTARVQLRILSLPETPPGWFAVQVGAFSERANAERIRARMEQEYGAARIERRDAEPPLWRVLVGKAGTAEDAAGLAARIGSGFVVRIDALAQH